MNSAGRSKKKSKTPSEKNNKPKLREKITEMLELPKEIVLNMPKLVMLGNGDVIIENYKGIVEYAEGFIRVNTTAGIIKLTGTDIYIKEITAENIMVYGNILSLEFLK
ncbi:sporulation protein YqfC [Ruminiclostridium cellulolyticum H10]|uniref:Sporulation protein YqfC n=2 Tax=Ruminiclostridium cellulolyticum TaxID=1521 RepID=B8I729_RUMCH|nr:sporulation protein YqfC [Ruminiclostridium cellulolyticum H10]